tara:strand:- start:11128 stop:11943 length:816 start_codon:yes stop_codon:yes gene_type:complete
MNKFFFDGKITDSISDVNVLNRGFKYNDSFFETIHVSNGKVFNIKNHLYRIKKAKDILKFNFKYNDNQLTKIFNDLISVNNLTNGVLRLYVFRNSGGQYLPNNNNTSLIINSNHLNCSFKINTPKKLCVYRAEFKSNNLLSNIKANSIISVLSSIHASEMNFDSAILLNNNNKIIETSNSNIFFVINHKIITPPVKDGCIDGTMRKLLMSLFDIEEKSISLNIFKEIDEVFISNSISGVIPIKKIDHIDYHNFSYCNNIQKKIINLSLDSQ